MSNAYDFGNILRYPQAEPEQLPDAVDVEIIADNPQDVAFDPHTGTVRIEHEDGTVEIGPASDDDEHDDSFGANLADKLGSAVLDGIANDLLRGIELDDQSRHEWLETTSRGIDLLGLRLQQPPSAQTGGAQLEGTSKVVHPLLKEAVLRFQANARGELLPADGPVKVKDDAEGGSDERDMLRQALEDDLNHYLTTTATEYYPDTDRMLMFVGFRGCGFKKVYPCPIKRRPVSESVNAEDLIVSNAATDLKSCARVTHRIMMRPSTLRRMQLLKAYRDVNLVTPQVAAGNTVDQKKREVQGIAALSYYDPQDVDREVYECYCEIEVPGYEHKERGKETGLPLPWKVTIDKDSRQVLEVRRNWDEDDEQCLPLTVFVKYPFVPGFGFYDIGLLQILGDATLAATAGWREMLDAGAFSCFPGFLYLKALGKQLTNEFRIPPGGGMPIDGAGIANIRDAIMPLPYQPPNQAMMALIQDVVTTGQRVGGTAEMNVGEGRQDAPVGTTLALIEQATKTLDAVHKRLHTAQSQEFMLLKERFIEDPGALWRHNKKSKVLKLLSQHGGNPSIMAAEQSAEQLEQQRAAKFVAALADFDLVPVADPNTSSQMARIMKATAVKQLQTADPGLYDAKAVDTRILHAIGWTDVDALFNNQPPAAAPPDPKMLMAQAAQMKAQASLVEIQSKSKTAETDSQIKIMELQSKQKIAELQVQREAIIHQRDTQLEQARLQNDAVNRTLDRQAELKKMALEQQQAAQMHAGGVAADLHKHHTTLESESVARAWDAAHREADRAIELHKHHTKLKQDEELARIKGAKASPGFARGGAVDSDGGSAEELNANIKSLSSLMTTLVAAQTAPREIVRDERGKPIGIRVKPKEPAATSVADNVIVEIIPDGH